MERIDKGVVCALIVTIFLFILFYLGYINSIVYFLLLIGFSLIGGCIVAITE